VASATSGPLLCSGQLDGRRGVKVSCLDFFYSARTLMSDDQIAELGRDWPVGGGVLALVLWWQMTGQSDLAAPGSGIFFKHTDHQPLPEEKKSKALQNVEKCSTMLIMSSSSTSVPP
jgi:hypothetical protein